MSGRSLWQASEGLERSLDVSKVLARDKAPLEGLLRGLSQELRRQPIAGAVVERPVDRSDRDRTEPCPVFLGDLLRVVEDDPSGQSEAASLPGTWDRQVNLRRHGIRESVKS